MKHTIHSTQQARTSRLPRRAALALAGGTIIASAIAATTPAKADVDLEVKASASSTTMTLIMSRQTWRGGERVTMTAKGLKPGEVANFGFTWPNGHQPLAGWQATANSSGVASVTVTWPINDPAGDKLEPGLYDVSSPGASMKLTLKTDGQWVIGTTSTTGSNPTTSTKGSLQVSPGQWRPGDRVTLTSKGLTPGQQVAFGFGWPNGHQPLGSWETTVNSAGVASVTVTWPPNDPGGDKLEPGKYLMWSTNKTITITLLADGQWTTGPSGGLPKTGD